MKPRASSSSFVRDFTFKSSMTSVERLFEVSFSQPLFMQPSSPDMQPSSTYIQPSSILYYTVVRNLGNGSRVPC